MPNICTGFMTVRGRADCVDEFIKILEAHYSYYADSKNNDYTWCADPKNFTHIPHFFRVFHTELIDDPVWHSAVYKTVCIQFELAWSVYCCMFPGEFSYYDSFEKEHPGQHYGSNIMIESKRLQLEIEIWSQEPGMCFQEHYKICSGVKVKDEQFEFRGLWLEDYSNYEEFKNDCSDLVTTEKMLTEEQFNARIEEGNFWYDYGLHEETVDFSPEDPPKYLAHLVMVKPRKDFK